MFPAFRSRGSGAVCGLVILPFAVVSSGADPDAALQRRQITVKRAVTYLTAEVEAWNQGHTCYSCHNNGDAIRALLVTEQRGFQVDSAQLRTTVDWLRRPREWSKNGPDGEFNDRRLARLQFASALAAAELQRESPGRPLQTTAEMLQGDLDPEGSWFSEQIGTIGSPITYGRFLATAQLRSILLQADSAHFSQDVSRINQWLRTSQPKSVLNAAAVLWAMSKDTHPDAAGQRQRCLQLIRRGQSDEGGWGPYVNSASEPFDTAVVVLALRAVGGADTTEMHNAGRDYLVACQFADGSWLESTRPVPRESYAHRVSTTAWCLQALVE